MIPQYHRDDTIVKFACRFCCEDSYKRADEGVSLCYRCYKNCKHERYITSEGSVIKYIKSEDTPFVSRCEDCGEDITSLRLKRI